MHSVLFVGMMTVGDNEFEPSENWKRFEDAVIKKFTSLESTPRIARNIWLIEFTKGFSTFGHLLTLAEANQVTYKILPFAEKPEWLPDQSVLKPE